MSDEGLSHALDTLSIRADIPAAKQVRGKSEGDIPSTYTSTPLDPPSALYPFPFVNGNDKSSNPSQFPNLLLNESVSDANKPLYPQKRPSDPGFGGVSLVSTPANLPGNSVFSSPGLLNASGAQRPPPSFYTGPWGLPPQPGATMSISTDRSASPGNNTVLSPTVPPTPAPLRFGNNVPTASTTSPSGEADIIPTAIVIKNIPFNIKREQLLHLIRDMGIPVPYAFNYHFDQGIFRGLAFANFHSPSEANEVVAALNGLEVSGRKLRVEYKKVLRAGEKERIEKEKALKRLNIPQATERDWKRDGKCLPSELSPFNGLNTLNPASAAIVTSGLPIKDNHQKLTPEVSKPSFISRSPQGDSHDSSLDLNDAFTLEIYSRVLLFKDDRMRDELTFSKSFTSAERRVVHLVSQKLGLHHSTVGSGDDCYVMVSKSGSLPQGSNIRDLPSVFVTDRLSPRGTLSTKKSVPDMRRHTLQPDIQRTESPNSFSGLVPPSSNNLMPCRSNGSLHDVYSLSPAPRFDGFSNFGSPLNSQNLFAYPVDASPVPYIMRPRSADIDALECAGLQGSSSSSINRSRSPLHRPHSPLSQGAHSSPVTPLGNGVGPLDYAPPSIGAGILKGEPDLPVYPSAQREGFSDFADAYPARFSSFSSDEYLKPDCDVVLPTHSAPSNEKEINPLHLIPPTITTSSTSDDN